MAVIFDPLFAITDFLNIPHAWKEIFVLRLAVAIITGMAIYFHRKGKLSNYLLVIIPFTLISLQNAYTFKYIEVDQILGHNLNYIALFLGAALFLVWPLRYSIAIIVGSILTTALFVKLNGKIELNKFAVEGGLLLLTSCIFTVLMIEGRYRLKAKEIKAVLALKANLELSETQRTQIHQQNEKLLSQAKEIEQAKHEIELMNASLLESNQNLEEQILKRTEILTKANKEMDQLVYSLSHDFRTPMVNARGLIDVLESMGMNEPHKGVVQKVDACLDRFDELLHDLMNYAVYWDQKIEKKKISLNDIVSRIWSELEHQHNDSIALTLIGIDDEIEIETHAEKIKVLIYCVLSNAIRFQVQNNEREHQIKMVWNAETNTLTISDNGVGIEKDVMPRVYEMYFRGSSQSKGAGLGLYISKEIADQINVEIALESEPNKGTDVHLRFA